MKQLTLELTEYDMSILENMAQYFKTAPSKLAKGIIVNTINTFDSDMQEFLEKNMPDSIYDEYSGRYSD